MLCTLNLRGAIRQVRVHKTGKGKTKKERIKMTSYLRVGDGTGPRVPPGRQEQTRLGQEEVKNKVSIGLLFQSAWGVSDGGGTQLPLKQEQKRRASGPGHTGLGEVHTHDKGFAHTAPSGLPRLEAGWAHDMLREARLC